MCVCVCVRKKESIKDGRTVRSWGDYMMTPPPPQRLLKNHERKQSCKSNSQNMWKAFPPLPTPSFFSSRPLFSVSLYFPCAWLAPTLLSGSSWEPDFCGIEIWRVGRVARGREAWCRRHSKGWWRGGVWKLERGQRYTFFLRSRETLDCRGLACQRFRQLGGFWELTARLARQLNTVYMFTGDGAFQFLLPSQVNLRHA